MCIKDLLDTDRLQDLKLNNRLEQINQWLVKREYKEDNVDSEIERVKLIKKTVSFQKRDKKLMIVQWLVKGGYKKDHVDSEIERVKLIKKLFSI